MAILVVGCCFARLDPVTPACGYASASCGKRWGRDQGRSYAIARPAVGAALAAIPPASLTASSSRRAAPNGDQRSLRREGRRLR